MEFSDWLVEHFCKPLLDILQKGNANTIEVLCYCKSGRHRSVAVAQMLALAMPAGYDVKMEHYAKPQWRWSLANCGRQVCQDCFGEDACEQQHEIAKPVAALLEREVLDQLRISA